MADNAAGRGGLEKPDQEPSPAGSRGERVANEDEGIAQEVSMLMYRVRF